MKNQTRRQGASARALLLLLLALVLLAGCGWLGWRQLWSRPVETVAPAVPAVTLSDGTLRILSGLDATVELRWFVPAETGGLPPASAEYLARVEMLLAEYERAAGDKLHVNKIDAAAHPTAKAAAGAAGIVPFTTESGDMVYLGLIVANGARQEVIFPLTPEWEAALESDVSRAIARVTAKTAPVAATAVASNAGQPAPIDLALSEELLRTFPDLAAQSFDAVAKVMRERTLEEFKIAAAETQAKLAEAQKTLADAQANKSAAAVAGAQQELHRAQTEQTSKLNAITARLQERITVLQQLKTAPNLAAPVVK